MASKNRIDLVLYLRVLVHQVGRSLPDVHEAAYEADAASWPYQVESQAPPGESWLSHTLSSLDYDEFPATWIDPVSLNKTAARARVRMLSHGITVLETRLALVCWYDASDRPFPR